MKLLIAGYYGFGNVGDELILSAVLNDLREHPHVSSMTVLSNRPKQTTELHGVRAVSRHGILHLLKEIWRADVFVLGGGGLFQNKTSQLSLLYYVGLIAMARLVHSPVLLYALGVETMRGAFWKPIIRKLVDHPSVRITVRDENSKEWFKSIGVPEKSIRVTADPVFMRAVSALPISQTVPEIPTALLIPRYPAPPGGQTLFQKIGYILRKEMGFKIRTMLFQPAFETRYIGTFLEDQVMPSRETFSNAAAFQEFTGMVGRFELVVSSRFHGLVLAACARRPFIGVGDMDKVGRLCKSWGMPFIAWQATDAEIRDALRSLKTLSSQALETSLIKAKVAATMTTSYVSVELVENR